MEELNAIIDAKGNVEDYSKLLGFAEQNKMCIEKVLSQV